MADRGSPELSRDIGVFTITMVGVGAMIGAGIFVLTGIAAGTAGPGLVLAFAANGLVTLLTAMAYAELGSAIPEAGGGYLWVKEGLPGPNAFLAGWMSWFAHSVAGSLYALGFGAYFGLVLEQLGWVPFGLSQPILGKSLATLVALVFVAINFKGVSETGIAGNIVTVTKILIILLFIASGLWAMAGNPVAWARFTPLTPTGLGGVLTAMGLTYVAFEGYEIIVQAGEEVKDPKRNIPRAVFWSLAIVIPLYVLVAVVAVGATVPPEGVATWQWLGSHGELGLVEAARQFMPFGSTLLVIGGVLSTMSALNATTFSSTRVSFAMGRDRNLPDFFGEVHGRTRTPHLALLASGTLIIFTALAIPIHDVAAAADVMFLLLFLQVNVAIITIRRKYGDKLDYGFLIPFFPLIPLLAIALMLGIAVFMFRFSPTAWYLVAGWIAVGLLIYFLYARRRELEKRAPPVALEAFPPTRAGGRYCVLVPVQTGAHIDALISLAATLARRNDGYVLILHVVTVPSPTPLRAGRRYVAHARETIVEPALERAAATGTDASAVIRLARTTAPSIVFEVESRGADIVVMQWGGHRDHPSAALSRTVDHVLRHADCDVAVLRGRDFDPIETILLPVAMPQQARFMLELASWLEADRGAEVVLYHAIPPSLTGSGRTERLDAIRHALRALEDEAEATQRHEEEGPADQIGAGDSGGVAESQRVGGHRLIIEETDAVASRIVALSRDYDLTIVGASREGWLKKKVAGSLPERIAREASGRILLLKDRRNVLRRAILDMVDFFVARPGKRG